MQTDMDIQTVSDGIDSPFRKAIYNVSYTGAFRITLLFEH